MAKRGVSWSVEQTGPIRDDITLLSRRARNAAPAFDKAADVIALRQKAWFASSGGGTWAPRKEPYHTWMRKKFPKRKVMHGPDRPDQRGLMLRDQLTRRVGGGNGGGSFGVENIGPNSMTVGTDLPYADVHQRGLGNMPQRVVMPPLDPITESKIVKILQAHIVGERIG